MIRHNYDLGLKKKILQKKKTNFLLPDRQTDGQPKTIVWNLTKISNRKKSTPIQDFLISLINSSLPNTTALLPRHRRALRDARPMRAEPVRPRHLHRPPGPLLLQLPARLHGRPLRPVRPVRLHALQARRQVPRPRLHRVCVRVPRGIRGRTLREQGPLSAESLRVRYSNVLDFVELC